MAVEESFFSRLSEVFTTSPAIPLVLLLVAVMSYLTYQRMKFPEDRTSELSKTTKNNNKKSSSSSSSSLKNIWEERQRNGTAGDTTFQKTDKSGKPFGSSYYYAHNNPNATGGYKDGLRMEDYQMETPRLLSKHGKMVDEPSTRSSDSSPSSASATATTLTPTPRPPSNPTIPSKKRVAPSIEPRIIPISKYLWDDEGNAEGQATIRIDTLPSKDGKSLISWKDAKVTSVSAELTEKKAGLLVSVETEDAKYRLHIPKWRGQVNSVKHVSKTKRLLIRVFKKRGWNKSNVEAWPHP